MGLIGEPRLEGEVCIRLDYSYRRMKGIIGFRYLRDVMVTSVDGRRKVSGCWDDRV